MYNSVVSHRGKGGVFCGGVSVGYVRAGGFHFFKPDTTLLYIQTLMRRPRKRNREGTWWHLDLCSFSIGNMRWT